MDGTTGKTEGQEHENAEREDYWSMKGEKDKKIGQWKHKPEHVWHWFVRNYYYNIKSAYM